METYTHNNQQYRQIGQLDLEDPQGVSREYWIGFDSGDDFICILEPHNLSGPYLIITGKSPDQVLSKTIKKYHHNF